MALSPQQKREVMRNVQGLFEEALDTIDGYYREPSRWEEDCLVRALAAMTCGAYVDAARELRSFSERSSRNVDHGLEVTRVVRQRPFSTKKLREGLANLRALG
jgi:hypothetical protein